MARPKRRPKFQVFISHSSADTWVAREIARHLQKCGAAFFLNEENVEAGDDFEDRIRKAAAASQELLILLTPVSITRHYVWMELGLFWSTGKRIVGVYSGFPGKESIADDSIPVLLRRGHLVSLNEIDTYLSQLAGRVRSWGQGDG
jgi:hypothetical protein